MTTITKRGTYLYSESRETCLSECKCYRLSTWIRTITLLIWLRRISSTEVCSILSIFLSLLSIYFSIGGIKVDLINCCEVPLYFRLVSENLPIESFNDFVQQLVSSSLESGITDPAAVHESIKKLIWANLENLQRVC